jgi:hypothetical protein
MFSSQSVCKSETAKTRSSESDGKEEVLDPIFCLPKMCLHDFSARRVDFHFHVGGGYRLASFSVAVFQNFQLSVGVPSTMQVPNTGIPPSKSITWGTVAVLEVDAVNDVITDDYIQELCLSLEKDSVGRSGTGNHGSGGTRNMVDPKTGQVTKESIDQSWKNFKNDIRAGICTRHLNQIFSNLPRLEIFSLAARAFSGV